MGTTTPNLGLYKPAIGETGWGTLVNANMDTLDARSKIPTATFAVAATNASANFKLSADYLCDGTADEVEINAAIAALPASGGIVLLSEGTFTIAAPIVCTQDFTTVSGVARHATTISRAASFSGSDMILFHKDASSRCAEQCVISDMSILGNYLGTQNVTNGVTFKVFNGFVRNVLVRGCNARGIELRGFALNVNSYGTRIVDCHVWENGTGGILFGTNSTDSGMEGCHVHENCGPGVEAGNVINWILNSYIWGNQDNSTGGGAGTWPGAGILLKGSAGRCNIIGNKIEQNRSGLQNVSSSAVQVVGNIFASNSRGAWASSSGALPAGWLTAGTSNQKDDIWFNGSGGSPSGCLVIGNYIDPTVYAGDQSRYAISLNSGNKIRISENNFGAGLTGTINIALGGSNVLAISRNEGYVTEAQGTGTIAGSGTSIAVTFGQALAFTPLSSSVRLTPATDPGAVTTYWTTALSTTGMTINCRPAPAGNVVVGYEIMGFRQP